MKKMLKILLAFSMAFTLLILPVEAVEKKIPYYVVIGDSVGAGFNLSGTNSAVTANVRKNYKNDPENCFGHLSAKNILNVQGYTGEISNYYSNLSCSAATIADIIGYIEDPDYYVAGLSYFGETSDDIKFHDLYVEEISKADILVLNCGNNDLMTNGIADLTQGAIGEHPIYKTYNGIEVIDNVENPVVVMLFQAILNGMNEDWSVNSDKMTTILQTYLDFYNSDESISTITVADVYKTISYFQSDNLTSTLIELAKNGAKDYVQLINDVRKLNNNIDLYIVGYYNPFPVDTSSNMFTELMKIIFSGGELNASLVGNLIGDTLQAAIDEFNQEVEEICRKQNIDFIDISQVPLSGKLDPHLDERGHFYVAKQIETAIIKNVNSEVVGNGEVSIAGDSQVLKNQECSYTITSQEGTEINKITVNGKEVSLTDGILKIRITEDTKIQVYATQHKFTTVEAGGEHAVVTGNMNPEIGTQETYTITLEDNYELDSVFVNGVETGTTDGKITIDITGKTVIEVNTSKKEFTQVTVKGNHVNITGNMYPEIGSMQNYTIIPEDDYEIEKVTVNGQEVEMAGDTILIKAVENMTIEAVTSKLIPFTDVPESKWYYSYVREVNDLGLMTGTSPATFDPSGNITRGQLATILYRMSGSPTVENTKSFEDVAQDKFYTAAIAWCKATGVVTGYSDGTFRPAQSITRQELALMLKRYADYCGIKSTADTDVLMDYPDASNVSSWAADGMAWAVSNQVISGDQGNLNPRGTATRAQCAKMILVTYNLIHQ